MGSGGEEAEHKTLKLPWKQNKTCLCGIQIFNNLQGKKEFFIFWQTDNHTHHRIKQTITHTTESNRQSHTPQNQTDNHTHHRIKHLNSI